MKQASLFQWLSPSKPKRDNSCLDDTSPKQCEEKPLKPKTDNESSPPPAKRRKRGQFDEEESEEPEVTTTTTTTTTTLSVDGMPALEDPPWPALPGGEKELKGGSGNEEKGAEKEIASPKSPSVNSFFMKGGASRKRLGKEFYNQEIVALSKALLGKIIVHKLASGTRLAGRIVEVEAYLGGDDKGAHSYKGKRTKKNNRY